MKIFKQNNKIIALSFFLLLINISCEKESEYDGLSGQLIGYVNLYDISRTKLADKSGVEVVVEGRNPQIKVSTDKDGQFRINNLKSGIYNITFNKKDYCSFKIVSYQFVGGNKPTTVNQIPLYSLSSLQIDSLEIIDLEQPYSLLFLVRAKVSNQNENPTSYCRYYVSNKPDISYTNYISTDIAYSYSGNEEVAFYLQIDTLKFPVGSELFMIMYPAAETYQYYIDIKTGKRIYTSININKPSEIAKITIPKVETPW